MLEATEEKRVTMLWLHKENARKCIDMENHKERHK
jgi:hypothetical protein